MSEQEIKAWSMAIAAALYRPLPVDTQDTPINKMMEWLVETARPIAAEIRKTTG
jgi:hypothetical protein